MQNLSRAHKKALLENPNVVKITESHVVFTPKFKIRAVELYLAGNSPAEIFQSNGIDPQIFIPDFCRSCIKRWVVKYEANGKDALKSDARGSGTPTKPVKSNLDSYSMDDLKAIIIVQEEMIEELKKKKALARKM
jgi:transposase-like protein